MLHVIILLILVGVMSPFVGAESIPEAVRRIDAKLQELERAGVGKPGPRGLRGARGPVGPQGKRGPKGDGATLDKLDELSFPRGKKARLRLGTWEGTPYVNFLNADGNTTLRMRNWSGYATQFHFMDKEERKRLELGVHQDGNPFIHVNGTKIHDYAELLELGTREGISPGSVVAYDAKAGGLVPASAANARQVVGVISGAGGLSPGMVIGSRADESRDLPVSMSGVIHVRVSAEAGAVEPGDLLVPSSVLGVGMRAADLGAAGGRVFGKALEPWSGSGEGLVLMLVMNR